MRSRQEILNEINAAADKEEALNELQQNTSKVAWWGAVKNVVAFVVFVVEKLFQQHRQEVNKLILTTEAGTPSWYHAQALAFQLGDPLVVNDNRVRYAQVDESKQIVTRAAISEISDSESSKGGIRIKVAKGNDMLEPLSEQEVRSFISYMYRIKFAGTIIEVSSLPPDKVALTMTVALNEFIFNNQGVRFDNQEKSVEVALNHYFQHFPFDEPLYVAKVMDAVQAVEGVRDVKIDTLAVGSQEVGFQEVDRFTRLKAGYAVLDTTHSTINYVVA